MNVHKNVLLALTSAALFVAAPISAQDFAQPRGVVAAPQYALHIDATPDRLAVRGGNANVPVALLLGLEERHVVLPGNAMLRVDPLVILLASFDANGEFEVKLAGKDPVDHIEFLVQALSIDGDIFKLCSSQLVWVSTDLALHWDFRYLG